MSVYSRDLRQRVLNYGLIHSVRETARRFQLSPTTVQALKNLYYETGDIAPRKPKATRRRKVSEEGELYLQMLLMETPDLTLGELCEKYEAIYGVQVSISTMHNTCKRIGYSYKKKPSMTPNGTRSRRQMKNSPISAS